MDPRERVRKQAQLEQGHAFERLSAHGDWVAFRIWMERARNDYEVLLHDPNERNNAVNMARWAEGYDALNNILVNFDKGLRQVPELSQQLQEEDNGADRTKYHAHTGRKLV